METMCAMSRKNVIETANGHDSGPLTEPDAKLSEPRHPHAKRLAPPRLRRQDLEHPENFHRRLAAWIMKQR